jgi:hypothetical protein
VLGLPCSPHPLTWVGLSLAGLLALRRWRLLGQPVPGSALNAPLALYLLTAGVGLLVAERPGVGAVRLFGLLAARTLYWSLLDLAWSPRSAHLVVDGTLVLLAIAAPLVFFLTLSTLKLERLSGPLDAVLAQT